MRALWLVALATVLPQAALAQSPRPDAAAPAGTEAKAKPESRRAVPRAGGEAGMVVTGEQEAPQVLFVIPWQEPRPKPPPRVDAVAGGPDGSGAASPAAAGVAAPPGRPGGESPTASVAASAASMLPEAPPPELPPVVDFLRGIDQEPLSKPLPK